MTLLNSLTSTTYASVLFFMKIHFYITNSEYIYCWTLYRLFLRNIETSKNVMHQEKQREGEQASEKKLYAFMHWIEVQAKVLRSYFGLYSYGLTTYFILIEMFETLSLCVSIRLLVHFCFQIFSFFLFLSLSCLIQTTLFTPLKCTHTNSRHNNS